MEVCLLPLSFKKKKTLSEAPATLYQPNWNTVKSGGIRPHAVTAPLAPCRSVQLLWETFGLPVMLKKSISCTLKCHSWNRNISEKSLVNLICGSIVCDNKKTLQT